MKTCQFLKVDGKWKCSQCGWTVKRSRPPVGYSCPHTRPLSPDVNSLKNKTPEQYRRFIKANEVDQIFNPTLPGQTKELGDRVEEALTMVGITSERVEKWMGRPCGCKQRKEKLNNLSRYVKRILGGEKDMAQHMEDLIGDD